MKHYYLDNLSNPNLWNVGRFDYALPIIIFFFSLNKYFCILFFLFPASLWLKDHNENTAICLFCVILAIYTVFRLSNIAININIFLFVVNFSSFLKKVLTFLYLFGSFVKILQHLSALLSNTFPENYSWWKQIANTSFSSNNLALQSKIHCKLSSSTLIFFLPVCRA